MAGNACSLTCNVKVPGTDKVKVSALWKDLEEVFKGDRREALSHYFLSKDSNFLRRNSDILKFDVDGEVTIASLKEAIERDGIYSNLSNRRILDKLNKELGRGRYDYSEALENVLRFNRSHQFKENFMASLKQESDGKYSVFVQERNARAEYELADHVMNKIFTEAVKTILKDQGFSVDFLDNSSYAVHYSTMNMPIVDGLHTIATILDGTTTSKEAAEVAGHFIVGAMQNSPLIDRLVNLLTPEVQQGIFKDRNSTLYREGFLVSSESAREAAGVLIGNSLWHSVFDKQTSKVDRAGSWLVNLVPKAIKNAMGIRWLINKILNGVQKAFGKYKPDVVKEMMRQAKEAAATAAQGFISNPEQADASIILGREDVFTTKEINQQLADDVKKNVDAYYKTFNSLKETVSALKNAVGNRPGVENKLYQKFEKLSENIAGAYNSQMKGFSAEGASLEGIVSIIEGMVYLLDNDMRDILDSLDTSNRANALVSYADNARSLRILETALRNMAELYRGLIQDVQSLKVDAATGGKVNIQDADMAIISETVDEAVNKLGQLLFRNEETFTDVNGNESVVGGLMELAMLKSRQVMIDAYTDFYGKDFIQHNARVIFKNWRLKAVKGEKESIATLIDSMTEDISISDRFISAAADCGDFFTSVGNKVTRMANMTADRKAADFWYKVDALEKQMKDAFGNTDFTPLLEVVKNENGGVDRTGNIISKVNYGAWEKDLDNYKKQLKADFNEYLADLRKKAYQKYKDRPGYVYSLSDRQKAIIYHSFTDRKMKEFHKTHSERQKMEGGKQVWVPNHEKYYNSQWDEIFDTDNPSLSAEEIAARKKKLRWYNSFMTMKKEIDALLPAGATAAVRLPQFTGRFSHRFRALKAQMESSPAAFGHALRSKCNDFFVVREDEGWMFGSDNEFNELEHDPLESVVYYNKEKINRLPIYGVNKLHDMTTLSTDIFGSMIRYASMAASYNAMSSVVDIFELGKEVMKRRRFKTSGNKSDKEQTTGTSRAYARYLKFVEKNVYGLNVTPPKFKRSKVWMKIANELASLGGKVLLYGNLHGGVVNTGTGMFEIMKEAMAGENFTLRELKEAHKIYFDGLLSTDEYFGSFTNMFTNPQRPVDKNSLWIRHWNILSQNRMFLHNQKFDTKALSLLDNRLGEWYNHAMMLPYSSGDHYMQTIPYYAMGIHTKVYDHEGNQINLMDAYDIVDGDYVYAIDDMMGEGEALGKTPKRLKLKDKIFRSVEDINTYDTVQGMLERINRLIENSTTELTNTSPVGIEWNKEERDYIYENGYTLPTNYKQLITLKNALQLASGNLLYNESDESAFMDKCRNICNRLHGIYNAEDKVALQQNFVGNLIMAMRGYALGMYNRRFANDRFNVPQGKDVEGSWLTFAKVCASIWRTGGFASWARAMLFQVPLFNAYALFSKKFGDSTKAAMERAGFSEHQYYNMRRCGADALVLEALLLMNLAASPGLHSGTDDDGDEQSNWLWGLLYYFTMRWSYEQGALNILSPNIMLREATTLLDYTPAGMSGLFALGELATLFGGAMLTDEEDKKDSPYFYKQSKKGVYEEGEAKYKKRLRGLFPYVRSYYAMKNPYIAASSYQYGLTVKGR